MNTQPLQRAIFVIVLMLATSSIVMGQTATLSGVVTDQTKAVIPDATVTVISADTGTKWTVTTNDLGLYAMPFLKPGNYSVTVTASGFRVVSRTGIRLVVGQEAYLDFELSVGPVEETVTIEADASLIGRTPAVGTVVDRQFVENLPLNGRSFQSLITLTPGIVLNRVSTNVGGLDQGQFSANGQRSNANYFMVDGVSANIGASPGTAIGQADAGSLPALTTFGGTNNLVSVDALQEFKVQTSIYAPEFGRTAGAQISIMTRPGTNEFHGTIFDYLRNDVLDANDWFANNRGLERPALRQNDFGGVLGGPIIKNRTFFFFSYEGLRLHQPQTVISVVPSARVRENAPNAIQPILNAFPIPNGRDLGNGQAEFSATFSDSTKLNATSIRIDYIVNEKTTFFGRYNHAPSESLSRDRSAPSLVQQTPNNTQTLTAGVTIALTPGMVNEFRGNWSKVRSATSNTLDNFGGAVAPPDSVVFPTFVSSQNAFASISIPGISRLLRGNSNDNQQRQLNFVDHLSMNAGSHQLKFGVDYRRLAPALSIGHLFFANFSGIAGPNESPTPGSALSGIPTAITIQNSGETRYPLFTNLSAYAQDTWRITQRFTLTYGLRWEYDPPPTERTGNAPAAVRGSIDDPRTLTLAPEGTPLYHSTYDNFAPRVGVSYLLSRVQGRETVLRGGFGRFYDLGISRGAGTFGFAFPYTARRILRNTPYPGGVISLTQNEFPFPTRNLPATGAVFANDPDLELPYTYQWGLTVEQALGSDQTISASYIGAAGRRLLRHERMVNVNTQFPDMRLIRNASSSDYHALQVQFQRRLSRGLQALVSYTWSHSTDDASSDAVTQTPFSLGGPTQDRGSSDFDLRHSFSATATYNIPTPAVNSVLRSLVRNWSIDSIVRVGSARTVNIVTGTDVFGTTGFTGEFSAARPDLNPGVPLYLEDPNAPGGRRINRAAFAIPVGRQGTLGRNALRGFPFSQTDIAVRRLFGLTEKVSLQFRVEAFNVLNHPNFGDPVKNLNSGSFGQSIQMLGRGLLGLSPLYQVGGPRSIQVALKLSF